MFKDAIWLAKKEYQQQGLAVILTILVSMFLGLATGLLLQESYRVAFEFNSTSMNGFILDLIFLGMAPSFGTLFMSKPYLSYQVAKHDPYGKRMAVLRSLPIPVAVLALSRTLLMLGTLLLMSVTFYGSLATVAFALQPIMTAGEFLIFILGWFGFMLAVAGMNPYIEYGTNGKILHILPFIYLGLFIIVVTFFYQYFEQGIVEKSLELVKNMGWQLAAFSLIIGVVCNYGWYKILKDRLEKRDYL